VLVKSLELTPLFDKLCIVVRVSDAVKRAAENCLGLATLRSHNCIEGMARRHVDETAHEVDEVGSLQE
jgi:hypothetical protein